MTERNHNLDVGMLISRIMPQHMGILTMSLDQDGMRDDLPVHGEILDFFNDSMVAIEKFYNTYKVNQLRRENFGILSTVVDIDCAMQTSMVLDSWLNTTERNRKLLNATRGINPLVLALALPMVDYVFNYLFFNADDYMPKMLPRLIYLSSVADTYTIDIIRLSSALNIDGHSIHTPFSGLYKITAFSTHMKRNISEDLNRDLNKFRAYVNNDYGNEARSIEAILARKFNMVNGDAQKLFELIHSINNIKLYNIMGALAQHRTAYAIDVNINQVVELVHKHYRLYPMNTAEFIPEIFLLLDRNRVVNFIELNTPINNSTREIMEIYPMVHFAVGFLYAHIKDDYTILIDWFNKFQFKKNNENIKNVLKKKFNTIMDSNLAIDCKKSGIKRGVLINFLSQGLGGIFCCDNARQVLLPEL